VFCILHSAYKHTAHVDGHGLGCSTSAACMEWALRYKCVKLVSLCRSVTRTGKNPANVVLLRGGGVRMALPTFQAKHSLRACIVAPTKVLGGAPTALSPCCWPAILPTLFTKLLMHVLLACTLCESSFQNASDVVQSFVRLLLENHSCSTSLDTGIVLARLINDLAHSRAGLGMTLGMEWLPAPGATGSYDSAFHAKAAAICDAVINKGFQFGFCHVKAVDDCGHDRLWGLKVRYIERMDALMAQVARRLHEAEQVCRYHSAVLGHCVPLAGCYALAGATLLLCSTVATTFCGNELILSSSLHDLLEGSACQTLLCHAGQPRYHLLSRCHGGPQHACVVRGPLP
jgi:Metalloenzyme superfamily